MTDIDDGPGGEPEAEAAELLPEAPPGEDARARATQLPPDFRSGFVAVVGRPNVGKSTLMNTLLGQKVSIVSPKPQTTRNRLLGILTLDTAQVIFLDTPGIHNPVHQLGKVLNETAAAALPDADLILWVVDVATAPHDEDRRVAALLDSRPPGAPVLLALNKVDRAEGRSDYGIEYGILASDAAQVRFMAGELVRESVLLHLRDEVPHSVAVLVNEFTERDDITYISAVVYVERDTQKMIVLGKDGQMIKRIGQAARQQIEELLEDRVFLDLWVKVRPKWRTDAEELRRLGYQMPKKSAKGGHRRRRNKTADQRP